MAKIHYTLETEVSLTLLNVYYALLQTHKTQINID